MLDDDVERQHVPEPQVEVAALDEVAQPELEVVDEVLLECDETEIMVDEVVDEHDIVECDEVEHDEAITHDDEHELIEVEIVVKMLQIIDDDEVEIIDEVVVVGVNELLISAI